MLGSNLLKLLVESISVTGHCRSLTIRLHYRDLTVPQSYLLKQVLVLSLSFGHGSCVLKWQGSGIVFFGT